MSESLFAVAILGGGLATRLRPLTDAIPKALVDVNGEPFIAHQLRLLRSNGLDRMVYCAGYRGEMIREYVGTGARFGVTVEFSFDGLPLLGTAGAIRRALPLLGDSFFVLYGDSYLPCDYRAVQRAFVGSGQPALMTVFRNENRWDPSNVEFSEGRILAYDKTGRTARMQHLDYGLGVFARRAFDRVPRDSATDLARLYQSLLERGELAAWEVTQRFYEVGSFDGLEETRRYLAAHPPRPLAAAEGGAGESAR
ncbi:MAG TPA: sugar phosphate nucleotidyltransferase [Gemmatimonadales bacterium]|jgi:NDP-sugar pyrophosphorylase family protein|nr:sugar phosphate nucleotidyltransferase [Gemmatimonadales bacterium]